VYEEGPQHEVPALEKKYFAWRKKVRLERMEKGAADPGIKITEVFITTAGREG
jgi:hypothetical protein